MNDELLNRIKTVEDKLALLESSSTLPRNVETAITERIGMVTDLSTVSSTVTSGTFNLPNTTGTLKFKWKGKVYKLLYQ